MFRVRVSATSANIGAGFDSMGLALNLFNEIEIEDCEEKLRIVTDRGLPVDESNLVYQSMTEVFKIYGRTPNVFIRQTNNIPVASGLGSSAASVVAGVMGANAMLGDFLSEKEVVNLCAKLDGHPDNVVPAVKGGISAGVMTDAGVEYIQCNAPKLLKLCVATPDFPLHTQLSRSVLPEVYSRDDVVFSLSRAVVTFAALVSGDVGMLKVVGDKLHEPYRRPLIKGFDEVKACMTESGAIASFLSGAGPTIIGIFKNDFNVTLPKGWTVRRLHIVNDGASVEKLEKR